MPAFLIFRRRGTRLNPARRRPPGAPIGLWRKICRAAFACIAVSSISNAATPYTWRAQTWHVEEGLPDNRIVGLAQTPDGYLCIATREGLVRFNGAGFENIPVANPTGVISNGVRAMFADAHGDLWLDMFRETLVRIRQNSMQVFTAKEGVPPGEFTHLAEDAEGHIWLEIGGRTCELNGERLHQLDLPPTSLACDSRGRVWCVINQQLGILRHAGFEPHFPVAAGPVALTRARTGGLWICAGGQLLQLPEDGAPVLRQQLATGIRPSCLLEDRAGAVWIGTIAHGLMRFDGHTLEEMETAHDATTALLEDHEGNIWMGSAAGGLNRFRPRVIEFEGPRSGQSFDSVASVCEDADGRLWVATSNGQLACGGGDSWNLQSWPSGNVSCVAASREPVVWVGTRGQGLFQVNLRDNTRRQWRTDEGLPSNTVHSLFVASDESVWVATEQPTTLSHIQQGRVQALTLPSDVRIIRTIAQDAKGDVWIGNSEGRTLKVAGTRLVADPIVVDETQTSVRCLLATLDGSLWIGYAGRGIGWLKNRRFIMFSTSNGLLDDSIWHMIADRSGAIWMTGPHGLSRFTVENARAVADGKQTKLYPIQFGRGEGFAGFVGNYNNIPANCRTRDGRILFATSQGLLELNPETLRGNPLRPPVLLERVIMDDRVVALSNNWFPSHASSPPAPIEIRQAGATLRLPPDHRRLAFDFAALSYSAPENTNFRYRLDGADDAWTETTSEHSARYSRLPAGDYTFRVVASNDMGLWNEQGATLAVVVSPFFWQTWWFRLAVLSAFTATVVTVVRMVSFRRLRNKLRLAEQAAALSRERERIARDIHDDVGGSLSHIKLLSESAVQDRTAADPADDSLRQITTTARQTMKSLDEIVWAINPQNDTLPDLISYLGQYAVDFLRAAGVRCEIDLPDNPPDVTVTSDVRHHVFLVLKEALTNVVRHADARTVRIKATLAAELLEISIEDDGRGFEIAPGKAEEDGLRNMRKRMAAVGGDFVIESQPGAGTRLRLKAVIRERAAQRV